jgi:ABC-type nickel/cobalt efflux system permease component RcnA
MHTDPVTARSFALALLFAVCGCGTARAHPVPVRTYDRTIVVQLSPTAVTVEYRLEVDAQTAFNDVPELVEKSELPKITKSTQVYEAFLGGYAPRLAYNLDASLDGKPLTFQCVEKQFQTLDHLRCDYRFRAEFPMAEGAPRRFTLRENNFDQEAGHVALSLVTESGVAVVEQTVPDEALKTRPAAELQPGDEERLRKLSVTFRPGVSAPATDTPSTQPEVPRAGGDPAPPLLQLLLDSERGYWLLLLLAAGFGAVHALTPGHGKTLVAAYLIGERGTALHAIVLGLITTLAHTGAVLLVAAVLPLFLPKAPPAAVQSVLGITGGILVAGLGFWVFARRVQGKADHVHLGGSHHHHDDHHHSHEHGHHHHDHDHDHDHDHGHDHGHGHAHGHHHGHHHDHGHGHHHDHDHDHDHAHDHHHEHEHTHGDGAVSDTPTGWWGLLVLGVSGGIVPCWDAIAMFVFAVSAQRLWLGLPLLLAFSAGLASVLIAIGLGVVWFKGVAQSRWGGHPFWRKLFRVLPIFSAVAVIVLGLWLCFDSLPRTSR